MMAAEAQKRFFWLSRTTMFSVVKEYISASPFNTTRVFSNYYSNSSMSYVLGMFAHDMSDITPNWICLATTRSLCLYKNSLPRSIFLSSYSINVITLVNVDLCSMWSKKSSSSIDICALIKKWEDTRMHGNSIRSTSVR